MHLLHTHVRLDAIRCYAYHGVLPQERAVGADYEVNLDLTLIDATPAVAADDLEGTVDYSVACRIVHEEMALPSALLEHVAGRIAERLLDTFPRIASVDIEVRKVNPPLGVDCRGAAVSLTASPVAPEPPLRLLVLDFDGTLADSMEGIVATMRATFAAMGWPEPTVADVRTTIGLPLLDSFDALVPGQTDETLQEAVATYRRLFDEMGTPRIQLFPHVAETLRRLRQDGITLAIATSRSHASVVELSRRLGIDGYIDRYVAIDDVIHKKPAPDPVLRILQETGFRREQAVVVGDTSFDVNMAHAAGCGAFAVTYGNHPRERLLDADALIDDFAQLLDADGHLRRP